MSEENKMDETEVVAEPVAPEEPEIEELEEMGEDKLKALRTKLKHCETEKAEHLEALQRTKAEFLNSKKRLEEEKLAYGERSINAHIEKLLPLCDSFDMAMHNREAWEAIDANWRSGVEGIHNQLKSILSEYGVTRHGAIGEQFDPHKHEAVGTTAADGETDTIVEVVQSGYERDGSIIRVAKVVINE